MIAVITHDREGSEVQWQYTLKDDDLVDTRQYAQMYADECGIPLSKADGYVPNGCGDFTVTIYCNPADIGSIVCWDSESFFFDSEY